MGPHLLLYKRQINHKRDPAGLRDKFRKRKGRCQMWWKETAVRTVIIDGQGGKIGSSIIRQLKNSLPELQLLALGTNSIATTAMLKAGADMGATGENSVVVGCRDADIIIGPLGIILADSFIGEITPVMARAVAASRALKILIPMNKCGVEIMGVQNIPLSGYIELAVARVKSLLEQKGEPSGLPG